MGNGTANLRRAVRALGQLVDPDALSDRDLLARFADRDDQDAFAHLVRRYTGLVLGVCRRALGNATDAEDACQATFLVLARKAKAGRWRASVANWLFTTARQVAANARLAAARRARREGLAAVREPASPLDQVTGRELLVALDEELDRLPPRYREPLVLCYLQGLTRDEVAARLGVPAATVKTHLERGRKRLGDALTKRGCGLGAGLLTLAITSQGTANPPALTHAILATVSGPPPAAVAALAEEVTVHSLVKKSLPSLLLAVVLLGGVGLAALNLSAAGPADKSTPPPKPVEEDKQPIRFAGRVVGPDGQPVAGAKLYLGQAGGYYKTPTPAPEVAATRADGQFTVSAPRDEYRDNWAVLTATAPGFGAGWVTVPLGRRRDDLTIRLAVDDVPIIGRIVDLEGKPIRGATLTVLQIHAAGKDGLGPWLDACRAGKGNVLELEQQYLKNYTTALSPVVRSDAAGVLRLTGIGRDRLVRGQIDGPGIVTRQVCILTRPGKPFDVVYHKGDRERNRSDELTTYHPADFRYPAAPDRPIVGVVRDKDTGKPLAGVTVVSEKFAYSAYHGLDLVRTTTDADGKYRLGGMPKGAANKIKLLPPADLPYVVVGTTVADDPGLGPVTVNFDLKRAVWIEGKLTDKATGLPVRGAVEYYAMYDNPNRADYPGFDAAGLHHTRPVAEDGTFRIAGLPGPGVVGVYSRGQHYRRADVREDEFGTKARSLTTAPFIISFTSNYEALAKVDPPKGAAVVKRDITVDPGFTFTATVVGPDGTPLAGARWFDPHKGVWTPVAGTKFAGRFNPTSPGELVVKHPAKQLVGVAAPPKEDGGRVTIQLQAGATISGRLVDAAGKPRAGVELRVSFRPKGWRATRDALPETVTTDPAGRFRIEGALPGYEYVLRDDDGEHEVTRVPRSGEAIDLGAVTPRRPAE